MSRAPAPPPVLDGYSHVRHLASGGFADVYLYLQATTRRQVAVKVLLAAAVDDAVRRQFDAEANLMALVSNHPSIVSVFEADIAADGRPYIVMEYCSKPNLSMRYRTESIAVVEALRIGVRLASAVETAHRNGILHRDIKPANVLTTQYDWPALTDFGISAAAGPDADAALGMSGPWSPPETFFDPPLHDARSDVWSLAATVYTLLARRSPFDVPGSGSDPLPLIDRIERAPLPSLHRADVPPALEASLARAMSKHPDARFQSALELARAWQAVEISMQLAATSIDLDTAVELAVDPGEDRGTRTRIRNVTQIPAVQPLPAAPNLPVLQAAASPSTLRRGDLPAARPVTRLPVRAADLSGSVLPVPEASDTVHRPTAPAAPPQEAVASSAAGGRGLLVAVVIGVVALAGGGAAVLAGAEAPTPPAERTEEQPDDIVAQLPVTVPTVTGLTATAVKGGVRFAWQHPDPEPGDLFLVQRTRPLPAGETSSVAAARATLAGGPGTCLEVVLRRETGRASEPVEACLG